ncbi:MAG: hypothetical protein Q8N98_00660, partial [bacterium]|nr:hypothetical protein [bacterium]
FVLRRTCEEAGLFLATTGCVLNLGCGQGFDVSALLFVFPVAQIHAVDYYNLLPPSLLSNNRVRFHRGLITQVLASKTIPVVDLILCKFMDKNHGFTDANIHLLRQAMAENGKLITCGDNGAMESAEWFRNSFEPVLELHEMDISVWGPRVN